MKAGIGPAKFCELHHRAGPCRHPVSLIAPPVMILRAFGLAGRRLKFADIIRT